jgi:hypothetical protein
MIVGKLQESLSVRVRVRVRFKYLSISDHQIGLVVGWLARTLDDEAKWLVDLMLTFALWTTYNVRVDCDLKRDLTKH